MKISFLMIAPIFILLNINVNAESSFFYDDIEIKEKIRTLDSKFKELNSSYSNLIQENKLLKSSIISLEQKNKVLSSSFETFEKNTSKSLERLEENLTSTSNNVNKNIQVIQTNYNKSIQEHKLLKKSLPIITAKLTQAQTTTNEKLSSFREETLNSIKKLQSASTVNYSSIQETISEFNIKIKNTDKTTGLLDTKIDTTDKNVSKNMKYWLVAIGILTLFIALIFIVLKKQIFNQKNDLESDLKNTRDSLEEEGVKLDNKLIELLETQFEIIKNSNSTSNKEEDHTLALKVADEIIRIQKNLTRMDEKTKGLKQLTASVKRIQDNFASNGYEVVEMLGQQYNDGMKVSANFIPDDELDENQQVITRIIKPQVNYNGVMIQSAQIEVSQGQ